MVPAVTKKKMKEIQLQITGMDCKSCAFLIEEELKSQPGITVATVNFNDKKATISFDEKVIDLDTIKQTIQNLGAYKAAEIA